MMKNLKISGIKNNDQNLCFAEANIDGMDIVFAIISTMIDNIKLNKLIGMSTKDGEPINNIEMERKILREL